MGDTLSIVEDFFRAGEIAYSNWKMSEDGRELRVFSVTDAPYPAYVTYVSYDGVQVEWPGVKAGFRVLPIVTTLASSDPDGDGAFQAAYVLDTALKSRVRPRPTEITLHQGHSKVLPHVRFDYPFPWEEERPAEIAAGGLTIIPVLAYSVSDAEAKLQRDNGHKALSRLFADAKTPLFDRERACAVTG